VVLGTLARCQKNHAQARRGKNHESTGELRSMLQASGRIAADGDARGGAVVD
jgi:hypothetical protein